MLVLHHLEKSRSQRLVWLLEELSIPYELVHHSRDPVTRLAPPELLLVHPLGKSPLLDDGGRVLAETGAIVEHLCGRYDTDRRLSPPREATDDVALAWRYWLHYAEGSAMAVLAMKQLLLGIEPGASESVALGFVDPQLRLHVDYWARALERTGWLAGDAFSAADIIMSFPIEATLARYAGTVGDCSTLTGYLERLHERPAYHRAIARGA